MDKTPWNPSVSDLEGNLFKGYLLHQTDFQLAPDCMVQEGDDVEEAEALSHELFIIDSKLGGMLYCRMERNRGYVTAMKTPALIFSIILLTGGLGLAQLPDIPVARVLNGTRDVVNGAFDIVTPKTSPSPTPIPVERAEEQEGSYVNPYEGERSKTPYEALAESKAQKKSTKAGPLLFDALGRRNVKVTSFGAGDRIVVNVSPIGSPPYPVRVDLLSGGGKVFHTQLLTAGAGSFVYNGSPGKWVVRVCRENEIVGYDAHPPALERLIPKVSDFRPVVKE